MATHSGPVESTLSLKQSNISSRPGCIHDFFEPQTQNSISFVLHTLHSWGLSTFKCEAHNQLAALLPLVQKGLICPECGCFPRDWVLSLSISVSLPSEVLWFLSTSHIKEGKSSNKKRPPPKVQWNYPLDLFIFKSNQARWSHNRVMIHLWEWTQAWAEWEDGRPWKCAD